MDYQILFKHLSLNHTILLIKLDQSDKSPITALLESHHQTTGWLHWNGNTLIEGSRGRGRPKTRWTDNIKSLVGQPLSAIYRLAEDRERWRVIMIWTSRPLVSAMTEPYQAATAAATCNNHLCLLLVFNLLKLYSECLNYIRFDDITGGLKSSITSIRPYIPTSLTGLRPSGVTR